jgi:hypothetical protein
VARECFIESMLCVAVFAWENEDMVVREEVWC